MSSKKKTENPGPDFVTRAECVAQRREVRADIITIKKALVGDDLRGGVVKDCTDMKKDIKGIKKVMNDVNNQKMKNQELSLKWKLGIAVALIGAFTVIGAEIIKLLAAL